MVNINVPAQFLSEPAESRFLLKIREITLSAGDFGPTIVVTGETPNGAVRTMTFSASTSPTGKWGRFIRSLAAVAGVAPDVSQIASVLDSHWLQVEAKMATFGRGQDARQSQVWEVVAVVPDEDVALSPAPEDEALVAAWIAVSAAPVADEVELAALLMALPPDSPAAELAERAMAPGYLDRLARLGLVEQHGGKWYPVHRGQTAG